MTPPMVYPVPAVLLAPMATTCAWARFAASRATSGNPSRAIRRSRCRRLIEHPPLFGAAKAADIFGGPARLVLNYSVAGANPNGAGRDVFELDTFKGAAALGP